MDDPVQRTTSPRRKALRAALLVLPAVAFVALLALGLGGRPGPPQAGDPAPAFDAPLLSGAGTFSLSDVAGKPVVLNFWASWCAPCEDEAPLLQRAHELYGDEVAFVGVDIKDARGDARAFAERHGLDYTLVRDEFGDVYSAYGLTGQPESFFVDSDGLVVAHVAGPVFEQDLRSLLDVLVSRDA